MAEHGAHGFRIRRALVADAGTVHGFIRALAEFEREHQAVKVTVEELETQLSAASPPFECYLAVSDEPEAGLGFALFYQSYSTWLGRPGLYLEDLFVLPEHRGRGVGKALFRFGARLAVERGYGRYEWAALNWNQTAIDFYRSFGAVALDEWTTFRLQGAPLEQALQTE